MPGERGEVWGWVMKSGHAHPPGVALERQVPASRGIQLPSRQDRRQGSQTGRGRGAGIRSSR